MDIFKERKNLQNRRSFLLNSGMGLGAAALASLIPQSLTAASATGLHHTPKAKHIIFLFMAGGPSQLDLFDYKPNLYDLLKKELPKSVIGNQRFFGPSDIQPNVCGLRIIHESTVGHLKIVQTVACVLENVVVQVVEGAILHHQGVAVLIYTDTNSTA